MKFSKYLFFLTVIGFFLNLSLQAQIDYSKLAGLKSKIKIVKEYSFVNVYDYSFNSPDKDSLLTRQLEGNSIEAVLSKRFSGEFSKNSKDSIYFSIKLITRMIVELNNGKHYFLSYKTSTSDNKFVTDYYEDDSFGIKENTTSNNELDLLKSILKNSNAYLLFKFYNRSNNKNYPEINRLKPSTKNENGVLDLKKLAKVIEDNKAVLAKYLN